MTATLDTDRYKTFASINNILLKDDFKNMYEFIVALINSKVLNWFYANNFSNNSELTVNISKTFLEKLPIPHYDKNSLTYFTKIVDFTITSKIKGTNKNPSFFEILLDSMTYELYFSKEIISGNCEVIKHLKNLPELKEGWSDEKKLEVIETVYKELSDPSHPVSIAMAKMQEIEEVKIIEGRV